MSYLESDEASSSCKETQELIAEKQLPLKKLLLLRFYLTVRKMGFATEDIPTQKTGEEISLPAPKFHR